MAKRMKRPLPRRQVKEDIEPVSEEDNGSRSWWARPDDELVQERVKKLKDWYGSSKLELDEDDREQLIKEAVRRDPRIENLLDKVIIKAEGVRADGEFLLVPLYTSDRGKRIARFLRLKTNRRIKLDRYGWGVWKLIDGKRDVREIGRKLSSRFGNDVDPLYPRLAKFLAYIQNLDLISIGPGKRRR
ncbi:MAG: PqqD family protein [Thermoplasmatota archaeon]